MYLEHVEQLNNESILDESLFIELFDIEDEFVREQKIQLLSDKAKALGVKTKFDSLLKAKKRAEKERNRSLVRSDRKSRVTDFLDVGNDIQLRTGVWTANSDGIRTLGDRGEVVACNHPIYPIRLLRNAETGKCKIELEYYIRGKWRRTIIDRKMVASSNSIIQLSDYGIHANSDNAKALVRYIADVEQLNEGEIIEQKSSSKLGWIDGTFLPYDKGVVFDNEENLRSLVESIQPVGNRELWMETAKELRQKNRIEIQMYLAASLGSVLIEFVGGLPFVVDLWGDTGRGKTVALMFAASIWGDPNEGGYITDAKATITAMEIRMNALNSLPMMIDDMAQIKNQDDDFSGLVYKWCSGRGKDRSNVELGLNKQTSWRNCILTNAERSLVAETMQAGAVNRIIDVEIGNDPIFGDDGNRISSILRHNYGFCGKEFIDALQLLGEEQIRAVQKKYYERLKEYSKTHEAKEEKQLLPMSILLAADEMAEQFIFDDGVRLDFEECFKLLKGVGEVSEHKRAYNYIVDMVASNSFRFEYDPDRPGQSWGEIKKNKDSIDVCIIGSIFSKLMHDAGFQDKAFLAWAKKNNYLGETQDGRYKKKMRISGSDVPVWCVIIRIQLDGEDATNGDFLSISDDQIKELPFV